MYTIFSFSRNPYLPISTILSTSPDIEAQLKLINYAKEHFFSKLLHSPHPTWQEWRNTYYDAYLRRWQIHRTQHTAPKTSQRSTVDDNRFYTLLQNENSHGFSFLFCLNALVFLKIYDYSKIFHIFMTNYCE